jgi:uncharacterized membrane protein (UPF0136 family)
MNTGWAAIILYIYGILLILGGLMGYVKARSVPSAVAGVVCGVISIICGLRYTFHDEPYIMLIVSLVLIILMGRRYLNTRKPMPALLIVVMSLVVFLVQIYVLFVPGPGTDAGV